MAEKNKGLGIPETKGQFQFKGVVFGTEKDNFYKETLTKTTQKPWRIVNFGIKTDKEASAFINLSGGEKEKLFFSKQEKDGDKKKTVVEEVAWKNRFNFNKEGFRLIGVNVGVSKTHDAKGNEVNDKKTLSEYDACKEIGDNLKDDSSVFIKGKIDYSHFTTNDGGVKRSVKFIPSQVSLCKDIDFDAEDFEQTSDFTQIIIFNEIKQDVDRFIVSAKIVTYNNIEDAEFYIENKELATAFKKNLKPYNAIKVWGKVHVQKDTTKVQTTDVWGESNDMDKVNAPTKFELIITGAEPSSLEKETYTEKSVAEAMAKVNANKKASEDFGSTNTDWGKSKDGEEEDVW
jgi:hypothetical protein